MTHNLKYKVCNILLVLIKTWYYLYRKGSLAILSFYTDISFSARWIFNNRGSRWSFALRNHYILVNWSQTSSLHIRLYSTSEKSCPITSNIYGEILSVWTNMSNCSSKCSEDTKCWGTVELTEGNCIMFGWSENNVHVLHVETKSCLNCWYLSF